MDWNSIGSKIKEARIKKGISQTKLASDMKVSSAFICQLEAGIKKASADNLAKISKLLEVNFFSD